MTDTRHPRTALITGASRGLGAALAFELARRGWDLVLTARTAMELEATAESLLAQHKVDVTTILGDVTDPEHLEEVLSVVERLDALVLNASLLGPGPQVPLLEYEPEALGEVLAVNVLAPLRWVAALADRLHEGARVLGVSSDAAAHAYPGWGGYGASKAALDHALAVLAEERPDWRVYAVDPGDMNTRMHQEAFPGQDLSSLPRPGERAPVLANLLEGRAPSGRYVAGELLEGGAA